jgi:integral membrane protein
VTRLFKAYRVLAMIVGVLLLIGYAALPLYYLLPEGDAAQSLGAKMMLVWPVHGWVYIAYVIVAFLLITKAGWKLTALPLTLIAGLVPVLIFWVEHRVAQRLRAENPELAATT